MLSRRHRLVAPLSLVLALGSVATVAGAQRPAAEMMQRPASPEVIPEASPGPTSPYLRPRTPCPVDLEVLTTQLLGDLPHYANRVASRSLNISRRSADPMSLVLVASLPDFTPLDLAASANGISQGEAPELQQVFFTTLERQYRQNRVVSLQHHHWLFLAQTPEGWRMALMYSSLGPYSAGGPQGRPPTPPQESSDGIVGQAVRLWLRDCRAGAVFPAPADVVPPEVPPEAPLDVPPEVPSRDLPTDVPIDIPESIPLESEPEPGTRP